MVCTLGMGKRCPRGVQAHLNAYIPYLKKKDHSHGRGPGGVGGLAMAKSFLGCKEGEYAYHLSPLLCT